MHTLRIEGAHRGQPGAGHDEVHELAGLPGVRLEVHLMVDGRDDVVDLVRRGRRATPEDWLAVQDELPALARLRAADAESA